MEKGENAAVEPSLEITAFDAARHAALVPAVTRLLHAAYQPLAADGLHYMASHQADETTLERLTEGHAWLFFFNGALAGTVALYEGARKRMSCDYYRRPGVWLFGQFAISPELQGRGLGGEVMAFLEAEARRLGASELALDTSERASRLIATYRARGFEVVAQTQWPDVNYRSLILSKTLA